MTFLGAAIDRIDRDKTKLLWADILGSVLPGEIKNVYTTNDWILIYYSACETEQSQGRNSVYTKQLIDDRRTNLLADDEGFSDLPAVAGAGELVFRLRNYSIKGLGSSSRFGLGHLEYRDCLTSILDYIRFNI